MQTSKLAFIALAVILTTTLPTHAHAQESCGQPSDVRSIGEAEGFCSVYDRQFAYRENRNEFRKMLNERREDYIAPYLSAKEKYAKDMEALNNERNHDNDVTSR